MDGVGELVSSIKSSDRQNSKKNSLRDSGHPPKPSLFKESISQRNEKQEKLYQDIFDHLVDKKTFTSIAPLDISLYVQPVRGKRCLDDMYYDHNTVDDFAVFEKVTEDLMRIVFENAIEKGFFGLLEPTTGNRCLTKLTWTFLL